MFVEEFSLDVIFEIIRTGKYALCGDGLVNGIPGLPAIGALVNQVGGMFERGEEPTRAEELLISIAGSIFLHRGARFIAYCYLINNHEKLSEAGQELVDSMVTWENYLDEEYAGIRQPEAFGLIGEIDAVIQSEADNRCTAE